jgi:Coenzyme PQQ synthesis protein D (PqqD)
MTNTHTQGPLRQNLEEIAAETIGGEAVIINLATGTYFSLEAVGAEVWTLFGAGGTVADVAAAVAARYDVPREQAATDVARFAAALVDERLLVSASRTGTDADATGATAGDASPANAAHAPYLAPRLHKYTDMADMLALDPPLPGLNDIPWKRSSTE